MGKPDEKMLEVRKLICRKISAGIRAKGWTQLEFADKWGKKASWVSYILSGKNDISLSTLAQIEQLLDMELLNKR